MHPLLSEVFDVCRTADWFNAKLLDVNDVLCFFVFGSFSTEQWK